MWVNICVCVCVAQSCLTLCNPMDCSPPGSFVHRILQTRMLEWVAISFSKIVVYASFLPNIQHDENVLQCDILAQKFQINSLWAHRDLPPITLELFDYKIIQMQHSLFSLSTVGKNVGCFQPFTFKNSEAMNNLPLNHRDRYLRSILVKNQMHVKFSQTVPNCPFWELGNFSFLMVTS